MSASLATTAAYMICFQDISRIQRLVVDHQKTCLYGLSSAQNVETLNCIRVKPYRIYRNSHSWRNQSSGDLIRGLQKAILIVWSAMLVSTGKLLNLRFQSILIVPSLMLDLDIKLLGLTSCSILTVQSAMLVGTRKPLGLRIQPQASYDVHLQFLWFLPCSDMLKLWADQCHKRIWVIHSSTLASLKTHTQQWQHCQIQLSAPQGLQR